MKILPHVGYAAKLKDVFGKTEYAILSQYPITSAIDEWNAKLPTGLIKAHEVTLTDRQTAERVINELKEKSSYFLQAVEDLQDMPDNEWAHKGFENAKLELTTLLDIIK